MTRRRLDSGVGELRSESERARLGASNPDEVRVESEKAWVDALHAAWSPQNLEPSRHAEILAQATENPGSLPSPSERRRASQLACSLEHPAVQFGGDSSGLSPVDLVGALRAGYDPSPVGDVDHRSLVAASFRRSARHRVVRRALGGTAATLAAAAIATLLLQIHGPTVQPASGPSPAVTSRSAAHLFGSEFGVRGTTQRMDRLAQARARELRKNRFAIWGIE
ncbi:hypothetical protein ACFL5O_03550 [Myxococcota bacterium]